MAKPDWGVLQQRFLSDHAETGVSPKEWCEAQGLNYATARRYLKKPTAQNAQKPAQKKLRTAQKENCAEELVDDEGLTAQQRRFVAEYLKDGNATQAAIRAGYSKKTANEQGARLLAKVSIEQAIAQQQKASIERTLGSADKVLAQMWQLATFDANQLSQYRRGACRYCWGFGHHYQWRDAVEFDEAIAKVEGNERAKLPEDPGGYGYDHNREPNPDGLRNGIDVTTTPEGFKFVYQQFVKAVRDKPELATLYGLIQASTFDNEANLPHDYIPSLMDSYPPELIKAYLRGKFTVRAWGNQILDIFNLVKASIKDLFLNITSLDAKFTGTLAGWAEKIPGGGAITEFLGMDVEAMKKAGTEADKEIAANKKRYDELWKRVTAPNAQASYEAEARGVTVKGEGGSSRESRDAVSKLAENSAKKTREAKATLDAGDRTLENYRAQTRTLTETLETLRQTGETHAKNTEFSKQQSHFAELEEAAKTRALTAQEKSLLSSREAILNAAKVVDQKNKEVEAQQKINGLAQQANKYVTQMSEKTDALRDSAGLSGRQTQRMMEEAQLRQGWLNGGGKLEDAGYEKELAALRKYYAEEDKLRGNWMAGAISGWNEYLDAATNTYDAVKNVASSTLTPMAR